jgi:hypothetical protein
MDIIISDVGYDIVGVFLGHGDGTFVSMKTDSTGIDSNPYWVALSDVNNDNYLDMVSANRGTENIGIFIGNGDGTFLTMVPYSTGTGSLPTSVAVNDINNDNHSDIVATTWNGDVIVFLGQGDGTFIICSAYLIGPNFGTFSVALADFNGDNYLDIVVANAYGSSIGIFLGDGTGAFPKQTLYTINYIFQPLYVIVADFNNDNINDIAVTDYGDDEVVIFYGYGDGSFALARIYPTGLGSKPYGITAGDLDNNKQLELVVALWGTGNIAVLTEYYAAKFINQTIYSTGSASQPFSVAVADFNNDNRSDIVVANSGTDNLSILFGSSNGTFDMEIMYSIGIDSHPQYVITCDINHDNQSDIVSVNSENNSISVIIGYGNGTFREQMMYSTGDSSYPYAVASGDFNNDSRLDLIVANEATDSVGILFGFDYTSFRSQGAYNNSNNIGPIGIVVSDFNNDTYLDIVATFHWTNEIGIVLGYGNGSFTNIMVYSTSTGSQPWGIVVGDFNNDHQLDIVVANTGTNNIGVLLGYGNGSFAAIVTYSIEGNSTPVAVAVGDFNNDGQLDIAVANSGADNVGVLLGYGNGTFSVVNLYATGQDSTPWSIIVADINNDGRMDIVVANYGTDSIGVLLEYSDGTFQRQASFPTGYDSKPYWITLGDFNGDNRSDIASANLNNNNVGILLGYGNGTFASIITYSTGAGSVPRCISVGDFNNDNVLDIAVANSGTNNIVVLFGFGDGSFLLGTAYSTNTGSQPFALAIGDFNNDTEIDIAVANNIASNIEVFLGYVSQYFAGVTTYSTGKGSQPHSIAVGDLNNDGWSDVVVANYATDNVGVLLGTSKGMFAAIMPYPTGNNSAPYSVAVADFNNDHQLDIVVTNSETDNIAILFGHGNGTFKNGTTYSTGDRSRPYTVVISDFNNDNISDIAVANSGTSNIFLLYGYGNGTFGNETSYPLGYGYNPYSIAVAHLNQENWMDIVIACYSTDHVETLIKMC